MSDEQPEGCPVNKAKLLRNATGKLLQAAADVQSDSECVRRAARTLLASASHPDVLGLPSTAPYQAFADLILGIDPISDGQPQVHT